MNLHETRIPSCFRVKIKNSVQIVRFRDIEKKNDNIKDPRIPTDTLNSNVHEYLICENFPHRLARFTVIAWACNATQKINRQISRAKQKLLQLYGSRTSVTNGRTVYFHVAGTHVVCFCARTRACATGTSTSARKIWPNSIYDRRWSTFLSSRRLRGHFREVLRSGMGPLEVFTV